MWSTTIRTGDPEVDRRTLDQHRAQAAQQGLVLHVQPLPHGGYYVEARPAGAPVVDPAVDPAAQFGGTLPSSQKQHSGALQQPQLVPMPAPTVDPAAAFTGTLPSRPTGYVVRAPEPRVDMHPSAQYAGLGQCQSCGREGPTKSFTFMQNIGAVVLRFPKTVSGHLCKFCVDKYFFKMTLITFFLGWWGVISFFYTLVALPLNIVNRLRAIGMPSPRHDAESVADLRARGLWLIVMGCVMGLVALVHVAAIALALVGGADVADVASLTAFGFLFVDAPALLVLVSGVRDRLAASRAARDLGIA